MVTFASRKKPSRQLCSCYWKRRSFLELILYGVLLIPPISVLLSSHHVLVVENYYDSSYPRSSTTSHRFSLLSRDFQKRQQIPLINQSSNFFGSKNNASLVPGVPFYPSDPDHPTEAEIRESWKAVHAPICGYHAVPPANPIRVRILLFENQARTIQFRPGPTGAISDEVLKIVMNGMDHSPHFELVEATVVPDFHVDPNFTIQDTKDTIWIVDMRRLIIGTPYSVVKQLNKAVNQTWQFHEQYHIDPKPQIKIVLMDWRDRIDTIHPTICTRKTRYLVNRLGRDNIHAVIEQVVVDRNWDEQQQFPTLGELWNPFQKRGCFYGNNAILHMPYVVRSDYAKAIQKHFPTTHTLIQKDRLLDVSSFWPTETNEDFSKLRTAVSRVVAALNQTIIPGRAEPVLAFAGMVSAAGQVGRSWASTEYLTKMTNSKIIVLAQRDHWEDHFRFFEAMVAGACVFSDPMLTLPEGYKDGVNIVIYNSLDELKVLIIQYLKDDAKRLKIAQAGYELAMSRHRTYHWMEELFFGNRFSQ